MNRPKSITKKVKGFVVILDGEIVNVSLKNPQENELGKNIDLLSKAIASIHGKEYAVVPCTITYQVPQPKRSSLHSAPTLTAKRKGRSPTN